MSSIIHYIAATTLFVILAIFCFIFVKYETDHKHKSYKIRKSVYIICGVIMVLAMLFIVVKKLMYTNEIFIFVDIVFWLEGISLLAFGVTWIVSGNIAVKSSIIARKLIFID